VTETCRNYLTQSGLRTQDHPDTKCSLEKFHNECSNNTKCVLLLTCSHSQGTRKGKRGRPASTRYCKSTRKKNFAYSFIDHASKKQKKFIHRIDIAIGLRSQSVVRQERKKVEQTVLEETQKSIACTQKTGFTLEIIRLLCCVCGIKDRSCGIDTQREKRRQHRKIHRSEKNVQHHTRVYH
jgi:hypothetical protein